MKLENQVVTLDQAKRLKDLGLVQYSFFWWIREAGNEYSLRHYGMTANRTGFSAYTVAELGELLPDYITVDSYRMHPRFYKQEQNNSTALWTATYGHLNDTEVPVFDAHNEAQCRAAMLIHLLENKLLTPDDINKRMQ